MNDPLIKKKQLVSDKRSVITLIKELTSFA